MEKEKLQLEDFRNPKDYKEEFIEACKKTESVNFHQLKDSNNKTYSAIRLIHACFGMQTETAEFTDAIKKSMFYGKELDIVNLKEELGDILWYIAIAMDELGTDFETEMNRVIEKLKVRYGSYFSNDKANNRNLEAERKTLSNHK